MDDVLPEIDLDDLTLRSGGNPLWHIEEVGGEVLEDVGKFKVLGEEERADMNAMNNNRNLQ